jgi:hypothetical protein
MQQAVTIFVLLFLVLGTQIAAMAIALRRFYWIAPPGKVGVRSGVGGPRPVSLGGILVVPGFHQIYTIHAEVESLGYKHSKIVVQLQIDREHILRAFQALATKQGDELRQQLQGIVDSTQGDESVVNMQLAEVGYRMI